MKNKEREKLSVTRKLYRVMPLAPKVELDENGLTDWKSVMDNEYWRFCFEIAEAIVPASDVEFQNK